MLTRSACGAILLLATLSPLAAVAADAPDGTDWRNCEKAFPCATEPPAAPTGLGCVLYGAPLCPRFVHEPARFAIEGEDHPVTVVVTMNCVSTCRGMGGVLWYIVHEASGEPVVKRALSPMSPAPAGPNAWAFPFIIPAEDTHQESLQYWIAVSQRGCNILNNVCWGLRYEYPRSPWQVSTCSEVLVCLGHVVP